LILEWNDEPTGLPSLLSRSCIVINAKRIVTQLNGVIGGGVANSISVIKINRAHLITFIEGTIGIRRQNISCVLEPFEVESERSGVEFFMIRHFGGCCTILIYKETRGITSSRKVVWCGECANWVDM